MASADIYTRGKPGEPDNRGESLVQLHMDRMQQQKEQVAMDKLKQLMPQAGDKVRALALAKSEWDIDRAVAMLRSFQVAHLDKVNTLNKKRKKLREKIEACTGSDDPDLAAAAAPSGSGGGSSSSDSGSSSGSEGDGDGDADKRASRRRSKSKDSRRHKRSSKSRSKRSSKDGKRPKDKKRRSSDKKDKRHRSSKRRARDSGSGSGSGSEDEQGGGPAKARKLEVGKYGFIREGDAAAKNSEFMLWATDVKGANIETLGRTEEKDLFRDYMDDYNSGTLPHRKYYNLEAYEREKAAKARAKAADPGSKAAAAAAAAASGAAFDARADEEEMRRQRQEARRKFQEDRLAEAYTLLKTTDRAAAMRQQELLRAEMTLAYKTGDRAKADKLFKRLEPDEK